MEKPFTTIMSGQQNRGQGNNAQGAGAAGYGGAQNRVRNANLGQARQIKCYNYNGIGHIARNCTQPKRLQNPEYFKDKMLLMQVRENWVALDEEQLLFIAGGQDAVVDEDVYEQPVQDLALNVDNVFQANDSDAFDFDMDLFCEHHEVHEMHDDVQLNYIVDSHTDYTSDINMIPYDQNAKDNTVPVVQKENKVAIGYKNPLCLTRAKQVQPALYNGHEIIKTNHVPTIVHNIEDTLEIVEITRKKINDKMEDPESNGIALGRVEGVECDGRASGRGVRAEPQLHTNQNLNEYSIKPRILAPGRYAIDVEPIPPRNRNNREVHLDYLKHLKESVETLREIVEEAKVERPLDISLAYAHAFTLKRLSDLLAICDWHLSRKTSIYEYKP
ncbi:integrase, catalytic region, zinc finger, CCHC-type containing protein [Tanacetum coccineum]|uniref:Integrase, catalytic region, zinc finger, CCHC-type containing protein n=1 Tax=Tanacetum coccineum TaxID=301880 RepID=A0ABQ5DW62_9ASTR